jgi:hypothetical protein
MPSVIGLWIAFLHSNDEGECPLCLALGYHADDFITTKATDLYATSTIKEKSSVDTITLYYMCSGHYHLTRKESFFN